MKSQQQRTRPLNKNRIELEEKIQNMMERKKYAQFIFIMVVIWLCIVSAIIVLCGKGSLRLSDTTI
jgi:hypothetical protein